MQQIRSVNGRSPSNHVARGENLHLATKTSSFLYYGLAYTVCLLFKDTWEWKITSKDKNLPYYERRYDQ